MNANGVARRASVAWTCGVYPDSRGNEGSVVVEVVAVVTNTKRKLVGRGEREGEGGQQRPLARRFHRHINTFSPLNQSCCWSTSCTTPTEGTHSTRLIYKYRDRHNFYSPYLLGEKPCPRSRALKYTAVQGDLQNPCIGSTNTQRSIQGKRLASSPSK